MCVRGLGKGLGIALVLSFLVSCNSTMPSAGLQSRIKLPIPASVTVLPSAERLSTDDQGEVYELSPQSLIILAFNLQPDIKASYQRFKSEEARYDFFYVSRDSLTPRLRVSNEFGEYRADETVTREREHVVELSVEKRFFDTTALNVGVGYDTNETDDDIGNQPFVSAELRYPLWESREKLERTSEDIFRRNELDDMQLAYIQRIRQQLQNAMFKFYDVANLQRQAHNKESWQRDLVDLQKMMAEIKGRDVSADARRLEAELAKVAAELRIAYGWRDIQLERLKSAIGIPFHSRTEIVDESFNPFAGLTHEEVLKASIATDPEIATLRNAVRNAEVQLDLARQGTWDITLLINGESNLEGRERNEGVSDWVVSAGLDVSAVDHRVTGSLTRQAHANIRRFTQAIAARENAIFVDTLEPLVRIDTLGASRDQLAGNLPRYVDDFRTGVESYLTGGLNIDDLLKRRETILSQEDEISYLTFLVGANIAELCAATGKFFELLNGPANGAFSSVVPAPS